jgi:hypothetical protein
MQQVFFKYDPFFIIRKNKNFISILDLYLSCSFHFIMGLFYELHFLKNNEVLAVHDPIKQKKMAPTLSIRNMSCLPCRYRELTNLVYHT